MLRHFSIVSIFATALSQAALAPPADAGSGPISELQTRLGKLGYDPGPVDGVMTAKTQRAMRVYQRSGGRPIASGIGSDPVALAQAELRRLGFSSAPADGVIGPQTRDAIIRFQAANHLPIDPRVSDRLLADLERAASLPRTTSATSAPEAPPEGPEFSGRQPLPPGVTPPPIR
jgi:peptidoglycan hydrolase-like protein with peptidoglycan-binding domain